MKYVLLLQDLGLARSKARSMLQEVGCVDHEPIWGSDAKLRNVREAVDLIITSKHQVGRSELDPYPNAQLVSMAFTGYNDVDLSYFRTRKPTLHAYYVPGYSTDSVAELTLGLALALLRRLPLAHKRVASKHWDRTPAGQAAILPGLQLRDRTVGIIGTGTIGLRTAEVFCQGFKCPLLGWARNPTIEFENLGGTYCSTIDEVFREADIVSLHLALIPETVHTANERRIGLLREDSILLNTARTELVDLDALHEALRSGDLLGAGLDVTEEEHCVERLAGLENAILTPHVGFRTDRALENLARIAIENVGRFLRHDLTNCLFPADSVIA